MLKKIVAIIVLVSIIFIPSLASHAAGDPMKAYAYELSIVKYDGKNAPSKVGQSILVYHPDLFGDVQRHKKVSLPSSYNSLVSKKWGLSQIIDIHNDWWAGSQSYSPSTGEWTDLDPNDFLVYGLNQNPNTGTSNTIVDRFGNVITDYPQDVYYFTPIKDKCIPASAKDVSKTKYEEMKTGQTGYYEFELKYQTNDRKITYKGEYAKNKAEETYYQLIEDSNLTEDAIIHGYLDTLAESYLKSMTIVQSTFGVSLNFASINQYYLEIKPVHRVLGDIIKLTGTYDISQVERIDQEQSIWDASDWDRTYHSPTYECSCPVKKCTGIDPITGETIATDCRNCSCGDSYYTYSLPYQPCGIKQYHRFFGKFALGASTVEVGGEPTRAINHCTSKNAQHAEYIINDEGKESPNGAIQYYIGPNLTDALVGSTEDNYYLLIGNCVPSNVSGNKKTGIRHYYIEDYISCPDVCKNSGTKDSDGFLQCAENFCDALSNEAYNLKGNTRMRKRDCILKCGYTYGKSPVSGSKNAPDRESVNSCNNANPYKKLYGSDQNVFVNSLCGFSGGSSVEEQKGIIITCEGDKITDFDGIDNDAIFDQRKYINIACMETSSFGYVDLSNKKLVAGQGIDYWAKLIGEKECTMYFDLEQWKFDYATIPSKDPDRRRRMMYIYTVFNTVLNPDYDKTTNEYYDADFLAPRDGEVAWEEFLYKKEKTSVYATVTEVIRNISTASETEELLVETVDDDVSAINVGNESIKQIQNMKSTNLSVNKYVQTSYVIAHYKYDKYCVTRDGLATVYKAPENGICYQTGRGANLENVYGKNVYYTDLNATSNHEFEDPSLSHFVSTKVSVRKEVNGSNQYYQGDESCPYIIDSSELLSCYILLEPTNGAEMHGNGIFAKGGVKATLKYVEKLGVDDEVVGVGLVTDSTAVVNDVNSLEISISDKRNGIEKIEVNGTVKTKNNRQVYCSETIHVIDPQCNVSCTIDKYDGNDLLYEIKVPEGQTSSQYQTATSNNMKWKDVFIDTITKKYLVRLNKALGGADDDTIVYGKVQGSACYNVCWTPLNDLPNCTSLYKPSDSNGIRKHCEKNWNRDVNNYDSVDDCITKCSSSCPDDRRDLDGVQRFCRANYESLGYSNATGCVNYCYYCPECLNDYIFRSVNNYNPFPNSYDSAEFGYPVGERAIGTNWVGKSNYIKKDDDDETSVTGALKNQNVEYVIELTPNDIREIRENTEQYNDATSGNDAYLDYVYMDDVDDTKKYYSKFINETIRDKFTVINGVRVR